MMTKSLFLASALAAGTVAQTTSVMNLFLDTTDIGNITLVGSVISAAPGATTYSISSQGDADCTQDCTDSLELTFVNGPSTFAHHIVNPGVVTWDYECEISDRTNADCKKAMQGPPVYSGYNQTEVLVWATTSLTPVTITAGLEKILAVSTTASETAQTAQTAASASTGPSETGTSASATSSGPASSASTTASSAEAGAGQNLLLAAICGVITMVLGL